MPTLISHVVFCQKFLEHNKIDDPNSVYVVGSLFPDIRYLTKLKREVTHLSLDNPDEPWQKITHQIKPLDPKMNNQIDGFRKGFLFHNFLDLWWGKTHPLSSDWFLGTAYKLYEDQIYYPDLKNVDQILKVLKLIPEQVSIESVPRVDLVKWIYRIEEALTAKPTTEIQLDQSFKWHIVDEEGLRKLREAFQNVSEYSPKRAAELVDDFLIQDAPKFLIP